MIASICYAFFPIYALPGVFATKVDDRQYLSWQVNAFACAVHVFKSCTCMHASMYTHAVVIYVTFSLIDLGSVMCAVVQIYIICSRLPFMTLRIPHQSMVLEPPVY